MPGVYIYPPFKINFHSFRTLYLIDQKELGLAVVGDRTPVPSNLVHHISTQAQLPLTYSKKKRKIFMVSKVDFEQRKNGPNMTFLVHHSGGTERLTQVARGLASTSSRVPSEARISWAGTSSGLKTNKR